MRVLHLIDPGSPGGGACTLRLLAEPLARLSSVEQDVLLIGHRGHARLAERCGVSPCGVISPPARQPALCRRELRRVIRLQEQGRGPYDLVHAWTLPSAALATIAAPTHPRLATLTVGPVTGLTSRVHLGLLERNPMALLASSRAVAREYASIGVDERLLRVLAPAVNPAAAEPDDRDAMRRSWGVDEATFVVGLLSEPLRWADARLAMNVTMRVAATGRKVRLVLHHAAARRAETEQWAAAMGRRDLMIIDDVVAEPWRVVGGIDAALLTGGELNTIDLSDAGSPFAILTGGGRRLLPLPSVLPLLWAMSAGVPVIADASDVAMDVIDDGESGLLVPPQDVNAISDRVARLHDDPTIAGRIGMSARSHVSSAFHVSAYCVRLKEAYEECAGRGGDEAVVEEESVAVGV